MITRYCFGWTLFIILTVFKQTVYVNADNSLITITRYRSGRKSGKIHEFYGNDRALFPLNYYDEESRKWERIEQPKIQRRRGDRRYALTKRQEAKTLFGGTEVVGGSLVDSLKDQLEGLAEARPEDVLELFDAMKPFFQKHMTKMLIAYKIKFFLLVPILVGGLLLIIGSSSLAGLFFAMFVIGVWSKT